MRGPTFKIITTTLPDARSAARLARLIVQRRLAACVQYWPITSVYRWKGKLEHGREFTLSCKTPSRNSLSLQAFIREHHGYEVPEILVTPIETGHRPYLEWLHTEAVHPPLTHDAPHPGKSGTRRRGAL